ncbi:hypothetical protein [uncultured Algibacter sp.]|uniref:hypothetical protein n=1 Tax=uncultured Algibacter sp. TaxID=298659 RepID=UPI00261D55BB|nr:hypothetical protein [uncultured Algibacter sp.]
MKTIKNTILLLVTLCFAFNNNYAQKMYNVHQDNVKPSMMMEYEKIAKKFHDACEKHNPDTSWLAVSTDDFTYMYVTPIENFADLDKRPMAEMAKAMGDDFGKMFEEFDKCYDSHGNYIITLDEKLSYMPDGISQAQEGQDNRNFYYIHYAPKNGKNLWEAMKAVKDMFAEKGSKSYYRVYRTGFGSMDNFYMVAISSENKIHAAEKEKANEELLGPERYEVFQKVLANATKMEEVTGLIRRDLSYSAKKE